MNVARVVMNGGQNADKHRAKTNITSAFRPPYQAE